MIKKAEEVQTLDVLRVETTRPLPKTEEEGQVATGEVTIKEGPTSLFGFTSKVPTKVPTKPAKKEEVVKVVERKPVVTAPIAAPAPVIPKPKLQEETKEETKEESKEETETVPTATTVPIAAPVEKAKPRIRVFTTQKQKDLASIDKDNELKALKEDIIKIEKTSPYTTGVPVDGFLPENRRAFQSFIFKTYHKQFKLALPPSKPDYDACTKLASGDQTAKMYQYQEFVRDYMRWDSPYRGLLIYHGLGSGKTCSAIAAAEALFSQSKRRIIVLTPASLQENFLKEISFCGFKHFRLNNNWVKMDNTPNSLNRLFAENVLNIPKQYLDRADVTSIYVPDFRDASEKKGKPFTSFTSQEQQEIRNQIENIVFYNPKKGMYGRIQFISYNGISVEKLKRMATNADTEGFDNAVVIIDEVHNIVRNMHGQIDPFLIELKGKTKKISFDPITFERWTPKPAVSYTRGILFYRLLIGARNSKIIGLSGTPMINFAEEIGILMNILHGYNHIGKLYFPETGSEAARAKLKLALEKAAEQFELTDFYEAVSDDNGVTFTVTMLPEGIKKIKDKQTVERIQGKEYISFADRFKKFEEYLGAKFGKTIKFAVKSEELLPFNSEKFNQYFFPEDSDDKKRNSLDLILMKRMSGLVSYYKGSRKDLMPDKYEEVVLCPMSLYQQKYYLKLRGDELGLEKKAKEKRKKAKDVGQLSKFWALAYDIDNLDVKNSWRVSTRQACNFAFPNNVKRPRKYNTDDVEEDVGPESEDINIIEDTGADTAIGGNQPELDDDNATQISAAISQTKQEKEAAEKEDEEAKEALFQAQLKLIDAETTDEAEKKKLIEEATAEYEEYKRNKAVFEQEKLQVLAAQEAADFTKYCTADLVKEGETYKERTARALECLKKLILEKKDIQYGRNLLEFSSKYEEIIKKIDVTPGSSLLYSNYLNMEGLGIFTMILDSLGWEKIVIERSGKTLKFSEKTVESLKKGKDANIKRYIYFTGAEDNKVRKAAINVFNMNTKDLPGELSSVLTQGGFEDNKVGNLCRLFCITSAGAEGLSLQNVRAVHIMEPHWNSVRLAQVKGRAIRICSHKNLEPPDRNVKVYIYLSVYSDLTQMVTSNEKITDTELLDKVKKERDAGTLNDWVIDADIAKEDGESIPASEMRDILKITGNTLNKDIQGSYFVTTDIVLYEIGIAKQMMTDHIQRLMKMGAVDCELNIAENQEEDEKKAYSCFNYGERGFLYHPDLEEDISRWTKTNFAKVDLSKGVETKNYESITLNGVKYVLVPKTDPTTQKITKYELHPANAAKYDSQSLWGTLPADDQGKAMLKKSLILDPIGKQRFPK